MKFHAHSTLVVYDLTLYLILNTDCWEYLQHPPVVQRDGVLRDIWDGAGLREKTTDGRFYSHPENLALMLSTDGVALFKSSAADLWPVFVVILNLPPTSG